MTESEKLDLLLKKVIDIDQKVETLDQKVETLDQKVETLDQKVETLDQKVTSLEQDIVDIKADLRRLHRDDTLILDEVERVHNILNKHKADKEVHTA